MILSIIVPAFNEEKFLGETLAQIQSAGRAFTQIGWETQLIVCDNNSNDRTAEIARAAGASVVFEPINQISRARNTGAAAFRKLGGFSYEAFASEDVELSRRLKRLSGETGRRCIILHQHPIVTSARSFKHFTVLNLCGLVAHIILHPHDYTASRKAAHRWYDGRR